MYLNTPDEQYTVLQTVLRIEARAQFNNDWHGIEISLAHCKADEFAVEAMKKNGSKKREIRACNDDNNTSHVHLIKTNRKVQTETNNSRD